ncbi:MAG: AAA family ATPase [Woronichinia naegeliana WA131]|uniref:AAA family ATPase n=1 Tax=Woronichinia naegeliana WA131 TaxID=2824559 RepID=A0A977KSU1_9CYAN|nr:MAG: AAA family ATPase [Woronichinia naegeliana WA131]
MKNLFARGSEWRKWDLHIHTPASFHWEGGKRFYDMTQEEKHHELTNLIQNINSSDIDVFGLMDYWTFDGYCELVRFLEENPSITCHKTILPGMELRIEAPVSFKLNIHILLSNTLSNQQLNDFKSKIKLRIGTKERSLSDEALIEFAQSLDISKARVHGFNETDLTNRDKLLELGSKTAKVVQDCLLKAKEEISEGLCLIILPWDTSDGFAKLDWKKHSSDANFFMQSSDAFEVRGDDNINLFLNIKTDNNQSFIDDFIKSLGGKPKPVVSGSDAHKFSNYGIYPSDKITWIKGDPTFDGLKYTMYDPSERVRISSNDPNLEFPKPYFKKIEIQESFIFPDKPNKRIKFSSTEIELNSGLVAIVGGRGTGKSILLDAIAKTFNKPKSPERKDEISLQDGFSILYSKNTGETELYEIGEKAEVIYLHIHQREVNGIVKDPELLSKTILDMLGISGFKNQSLNEIDDILSNMKDCQDWLDQHDKNQSNLTVEKRTQLIETITTEKNREILEKYSNNISLVNKHEKHISKLISLANNLNRISEEINNEIREINNELSEYSIPSLDFNPQIDSTNQVKLFLDSAINQLKNQNICIQEELKNEKIEGDPITLLDKVKEYRAEIEEQQEIIRQIDEYQDELQSLQKKRNDFVELLNNELHELVNQINNKWKEKIDGRIDWNEQQKNLIKDLLKPIDIFGEIYFNVEEFYKQVADTFLNLIKFPKTKNSTSLAKVKSTIPINSYDDYKCLIKNEPIIKIDQEVLTLQAFLEKHDYFKQDGSNKFQKFLFSETERKKYLNVIARIQYDGKSPEELSVGQRGTLYLCLKLATESFFDPIIIDQPEDDLDNDFIMKRLVPIFLTIKKYRQVIIVTHNANLVINADAEQVVIAENNSESLSYSSGLSS